MDIDVMAYISKAIQGDVSGTAEGSFDCVMCGLCSARCPAEEVQYNVAILARRLFARHIAPSATHVHRIVEKIEGRKFDKAFRELKALDLEELKKRYKGLETEPDIAGEDWVPNDKTWILGD